MLVFGTLSVATTSNARTNRVAFDLHPNGTPIPRKTFRHDAMNIVEPVDLLIQQFPNHCHTHWCRTARATRKFSGRSNVFQLIVLFV